jgi:methyl-accepting chemotaxis protein
MNILASWRVSTRMRVFIGVVLIGLLILCLTALFNLKNTMLEDRQAKTKNLVEVGVGILNYYQQQSLAGKTSEDDAKKLARETLRGLRYGGDNYFFVVDTAYNYVLMPPKPESEGKNSKDMKDAKGNLLFQEIVAAAQSGKGFVEYWFPKAGQEKAQQKLSYVAMLPAWGWVVGTGIYIDDVEAEYQKNAFVLGGISLTLIVILAIFGWAISASILRQLGGEPMLAASIMQQVAAGDLTTKISGLSEGSMLHALDSMVGSLHDLVREINTEAGQLVNNAERISHASNEVAVAAEHQTDATSAMAAAIEELTVSSNHISDSARDTERDSRETMVLANEGSSRVTKASRSIQQIASTVSNASERIHALKERAGQVSSIANVIKDIAGQTNLLALNAAIEAARAGEQGRGFAVVADEVRKLAERTSLATNEIETMIGGIQDDTVGAVEAMSAVLPEVMQGVELADSASESLKSIERGALRNLDRVKEVADATREQSATSTSIAQRVELIAQMVEETTTTIRGTASTANELERIAINLKNQISRFKI